MAILLLLAFDPGIMSNDSVAMLEQARSWRFTDWHPPLMSIIWSVTDKVIPGPAGMLIAQVLLYAFAASRLCAKALPSLTTWAPAWVVVLVFSLFPPASALIGMIWKDVWMSGFLLLALSFLFELQTSGHMKRRRLFFAVVGCCLAATAFRHNAIGATAGLLAWGVYAFLGNGTWLRRFLLSSAAGVALAFLMLLVVNVAHRFIATSENITTTILLHDIAGIILRADDPEQAALFALGSEVALTTSPDHFVPRLQAHYSPAIASNVVASRRKPNAPFSVPIFDAEHDAEGVQSVWKAMVTAHPLAYIRHRAATFKCLLQLCDKESWISHSYVMNPRYALPETLNPLSIQYTLRRALLTPRFARLYSPAFWLSVTIAAGLVGLLARHNHSHLVFLSLSSIGLATTLFFTSPIECYRYIHWTIMLGWLCLFLLADHCLRRRRQLHADQDQAPQPLPMQVS